MYALQVETVSGWRDETEARDIDRLLDMFQHYGDDENVRIIYRDRVVATRISIRPGHRGYC